MDSKELWWEDCNGTSRQKQRSVIAVSICSGRQFDHRSFFPRPVGMAVLGKSRAILSSGGVPPLIIAVTTALAIAGISSE